MECGTLAINLFKLLSSFFQIFLVISKIPQQLVIIRSLWLIKISLRQKASHVSSMVPYSRQDTIDRTRTSPRDSCSRAHSNLQDNPPINNRVGYITTTNTPSQRCRKRHATKTSWDIFTQGFLIKPARNPHPSMKINDSKNKKLPIKFNINLSAKRSRKWVKSQELMIE